MIQELERKGYKKNAPNKYHIDCSYYEKNTDNIHITESVRNKKDVSVLEAVLENKNIKQRHIVVKMGRENTTIEKEFHYGKILENAKIPGFIRYICIFDCLDNTHTIQTTPKYICKGTNIPENRKNVLIMPYIQEGSLRKFNWNHDNFDVLKSVILQTIMSSFVAYDKCGFIHGDFHLDNILLKKTKKREIIYRWMNNSVSIPTYGYKIVIMDFDSSWMVEEREMGISLYWINLQNMFSRINTDLRTKTEDVVRMKNHTKIMQFIETNIDKKGKIENTLKLIDKINIVDFEIIENPLSKLVYDPNRWG
jgi:RIO-like serine/threonine protein kinase